MPARTRTISVPVAANTWVPWYTGVPARATYQYIEALGLVDIGRSVVVFVEAGI